MTSWRGAYVCSEQADERAERDPARREPRARRAQSTDSGRLRSCCRGFRPSARVPIPALADGLRRARPVLPDRSWPPTAGGGVVTTN
jgi:hypothetical protein